jgi:hypothetical protein
VDTAILRGEVFFVKPRNEVARRLSLLWYAEQLRGIADDSRICVRQSSLKGGAYGRSVVELRTKGV